MNLVYLVSLIPAILVKNFKKPLVFVRANSESRNGSTLLLDADGVLWPNSTTLFGGGKISTSKKNSLIESLNYFSRIFVLTNQTGPARNSHFSRFSYLKLIYRSLFFMFRYKIFSGLIICPHHPRASNADYRYKCYCRKPLAGLFDEIPVSPFIKSDMIMVGDRITDIIAAASFGVRKNVLIRNDEMFEFNVSSETQFGNPLFNVAHDLESYLHSQRKMPTGSDCFDLQVLYLAAGKGSRLRPLTDKVPKPLLELENGETILTRLISQFSKYFPNAKHIVNVSSKTDLFFDELFVKNRLLNIYYHYEVAPLGSAQTLASVVRQSSLPTLVIHGDLVLSDHGVNDLASFVNSFSHTFMVGHYRDHLRARSQIYAESNRIVKFINETPKESGKYLVNSGMYFFGKEVLESISNFEFDSFAELPNFIVSDLVKTEFMHVKLWKGDRFSVDSLERLQSAREYLKAKNA